MKQLATKYKTMLDNYGINTPLRLAHFFAQIDHESAGGKFLTELGGRSYFDKYEGRKDLGNIQKGDGFTYRGRGFIQVTGRANYQLISKDLRIDYLNNPDKLANEADAMLSACWFWNRNKLNVLADKDDVKAVTKKINGGFNGLADRTEKLNKYKKIFGI